MHTFCMKVWLVTKEKFEKQILRTQYHRILLPPLLHVMYDVLRVNKLGTSNKHVVFVLPLSQSFKRETENNN